MSFKLPLISVIVPVYNTEKYLDECIKSIINQNYENIEILLVDDGSTDKSGQICDTYASEYKNIKVLHLENGGPSRARNIGLSIATGEYIGFVDCDDYIDKNMYQSLLGIAEDNNADLVMCGINSFDEKKISPVKIEFESVYPDSNSIMNNLLTRTCKPDHDGLYPLWNKLYKSEIIKKNNILLNTSLYRDEDVWFIIDYLKSSNIVCFIEDRLYYYRLRSGSILHTIKNKDYLVHKNHRIKLENEINKLGISYELNDFYYGFLLNSISYCRNMMVQKDNESVNKVLKDDYFRNACKYSKSLPLHYRLICYLERLNFLFGIQLLLKIWNIVKA